MDDSSSYESFHYSSSPYASLDDNPLLLQPLDSNPPSTPSTPSSSSSSSAHDETNSTLSHSAPPPPPPPRVQKTRPRAASGWDVLRAVVTHDQSAAQRYMEARASQSDLHAPPSDPTDARPKPGGGEGGGEEEKLKTPASKMLGRRGRRRSSVQPVAMLMATPPHVGGIRATREEIKAPGVRSPTPVYARGERERQVEANRMSEVASRVLRRFPRLDLVLFALFIVWLTVSTLRGRTQDANKLRDSLVERFANPEFAGQASPDDWYAWVASTLIPNLYAFSETHPPGAIVGVSASATQLNGIDLLLGRTRIRQIRGRYEKCRIPANARSVVTHCDREGSSREDSAPFGSVNVTFVHASGGALDTDTFIGRHGTYSGGGYVRDLPNSLQGALDELALLQQAGFLTRRTRALFVDFSIYNPAINQVGVVRLLTEFPVTGTALPTAHVDVIAPYPYTRPTDYVYLTLDLCALCILCYFTTHVFSVVRRERKKIFATRFAAVWYMALLILIFFVIAVLRITSGIMATRLFSFDTQEYHDIHRLVNVIYATNFLYGIGTMLAWGYLIRYARSIPMTALYARALVAMLVRVLPFFVLMGVIFICFVHGGHIMFSQTVEGFEDMFTTFMTLTMAMLGEIELGDFEENEPVLGPVFIVVFILTIWTFLLNLLVAVLSSTYDDVVTAEFRAKANKAAAKANILGSSVLPTRWKEMSAAAAVDVEKASVSKDEVLDPSSESGDDDNESDDDDWGKRGSDVPSRAWMTELVDKLITSLNARFDDVQDEVAVMTGRQRGMTRSRSASHLLGPGGHMADVVEEAMDAAGLRAAINTRGEDWKREGSETNPESALVVMEELFGEDRTKLVGEELDHVVDEVEGGMEGGDVIAAQDVLETIFDAEDAAMERVGMEDELVDMAEGLREEVVGGVIVASSRRDRSMLVAEYQARMLGLWEAHLTALATSAPIRGLESRIEELESSMVLSASTSVVVDPDAMSVLVGSLEALHQRVAHSEAAFEPHVNAVQSAIQGFHQEMRKKMEAMSDAIVKDKEHILGLETQLGEQTSIVLDLEKDLHAATVREQHLEDGMRRLEAQLAQSVSREEVLKARLEAATQRSNEMSHQLELETTAFSSENMQLQAALEAAKSRVQAMEMENFRLQLLVAEHKEELLAYTSHLAITQDMVQSAQKHLMRRLSTTPQRPERRRTTKEHATDEEHASDTGTDNASSGSGSGNGSEAVE